MTLQVTLLLCKVAITFNKLVVLQIHISYVLPVVVDDQYHVWVSSNTARDQYSDIVKQYILNTHLIQLMLFHFLLFLHLMYMVCTRDLLHIHPDLEFG